ncbi:MAG: hypothetical protein QNJ98_15835 [Planctomycetota bacterium]|nr:hypothetical protein [Planctomycetota bacterium]
MNYYEREIIGWLCLLVGFFFIAKSVIARRDRAQMRELLGLSTDKVKRFRNFALQRLERVVGFLFCLVGIGLHIYIAVRKGQKEEGVNDPAEALGVISTYLAIAVVFMLLVVVFMHWLMTLMSRRIFLDNLAYLMARQNYRIADDPDLMRQIGDMLGEPRRPDDTVESYTARLEGKLRLDEIRAALLERGKLPGLPVEDDEPLP